MVGLELSIVFFLRCCGQQRHWSRYCCLIMVYAGLTFSFNLLVCTVMHIAKHVLFFCVCLHVCVFVCACVGVHVCLCVCVCVCVCVCAPICI